MLQWIMIGTMLTLLTQFVLLALVAWGIVSGSVSDGIGGLAVRGIWCISVFVGSILVCLRVESKQAIGAAAQLASSFLLIAAINIFVFDGNFSGIFESMLWGIGGSLSAFLVSGAIKNKKNRTIVKLNKLHGG